MKNVIIPFLLVLTVSLTSCSQMNKGQTGAGIGAASGALIGQAIGHNSEATLIGTAIGGLLGYIVGNEMDKYDKQQLNHVYERGISGQSSAWRNPDNGNTYSVTPSKPYYESANKPCRQAEILATIDGKTEKTYSTACRNNDGHWALQE